MPGLRTLVRAVAGASFLFCCMNALAATAMVSGDGDIVAGRYIVVYRQGTAMPTARVAAAGGRLLQWHAAAGAAVMAVERGQEAAFANAISRQGDALYVLHDRVVHAHDFKAVTAGTGLQSVWARPIGAETPDRATAVPATDFYYSATPQGWAVKMVGGYGAGIGGGLVQGPWDVTMGRGVRIAVLDSGVDETHPDIAPNLVLNITEVNQASLPSVCDDGSPMDQQGHGTWAASLAAAATGEGLVVGVAPQASILNIKVMQRMPGTNGGDEAAQCESGEASGLLSWVLQGIEDAVEQRADVITLSLGVMVDMQTGEGAGLKASFDRVTYAAEQAGAVVVAAAGNDGFDFSDARYVELPAQARGVLAVVASTNPACAETATMTAACVAGAPALAYYANRGAMLNAVAAPGGSYPEGGDDAVSGFVRGACSRGLPETVDGLPGDDAHSLGCFGLGHQAYVQAMGSSASAPLAAGVAALLRAAHPEWDAATLIERMRVSATPLADGYGVVNAAAALGLQ